MRLLRVELTRLISRRACVVLMLFGVLGAGIVAGSYIHDHAPPSAGEVAAATKLAERSAHQRYVVHQLARCEAGKGPVPARLRLPGHRRRRPMTTSTRRG